MMDLTYLKYACGQKLYGTTAFTCLTLADRLTTSRDVSPNNHVIQNDDVSNCKLIISSFKLL